MLQAQLPIFPEGINKITPNLAFKKENGIITYFNFSMPVFTHDEKDLPTFRMITSQFYVNGNVTQSQICKAFGVTSISVKRAVKIYREKGPKGFYEARKTRGAAILTAEILQETQCYLNEDLSQLLKVQRKAFRW